MQLEELRSFWAKVLGVAGPQWMIVMALQRLDQGQGASVQALADMMQTTPDFVASQARLLERKGLVRETAVGDDGLTMMLSLTDQARQHLAGLAPPPR